MKSDLKKEAVRLRKAGYSYSSIREKIGVSKSTLTLWLREVPYAPNQEMLRRFAIARLASAEALHRIRQESFDKARVLAIGDIGSVSKRDLFMLGLGIYVGEGSKTANSIRVSNSDPRIIRLMIRWLAVACGMDKRNFRLRLHLYPDSDRKAAESYWQKQTGLPAPCFLKPQIDRRKDKRKDRRGKLPHGTAHLSAVSNGKEAFGVLLFRRILSWMEIVLEKKH